MNRPGVVPAVLELGDLTIENLSSTRVMRYITDRCILNDRVFFILALDFFLSLFILMGFRLNVELLLRDAGADYADEKTYIYYGTSGTYVKMWSDDVLFLRQLKSNQMVYSHVYYSQGWRPTSCLKSP
jgi:hypothetical protein